MKNLPKNEEVKSVLEVLLDGWRQRLGSSVEVILGGILVSDDNQLDKEIQAIELDVIFLVDDTQVLDDYLLIRIEDITRLRLEQTISVADWPEGSSTARKLEGRITTIQNIPLLKVDGYLRNRRYRPQ